MFENDSKVSNHVESQPAPAENGIKTSKQVQGKEKMGEEEKTFKSVRESWG